MLQHKKDFGVGVASLAFGAWIYYMSGSLKAKSAFWPKLIAGAIVLLGVVIVVFSILELMKDKKTGAKDKSAKAKPDYLRVALITALLFAYYFGFQYFSYTISTFLLILSTSVILGYKNWKVLLPSSLLVSIGLYIAFSQFLGTHFTAMFF